MKAAPSIVLCLTLSLWLPAVGWGQTPQSSPASPAPQPATGYTSSSDSDVSYHEVIFLPSYRFVSPSGFAGRVGEYDSLNQSAGGELSWSFVDHLRENSWKFRSEFVSRDEYESHNQFKLWQFLTLSMENRSMIRHLENVPLGSTNVDGTISNILSPDIAVDVLPDQALYGVQRRMNTFRADIKIPKSPVSFYVKGSWGSRNGVTDQQHYDMGSDPTSCDAGACHQYSQYRNINYTTRGISGGLRLKIKQAVLSFEHSFRSFNDRMPNPVGPFGVVEFSPAEPPPPGVSDTPAGNYSYNVLPSHRTFTDLLRLHAPLSHGVTFNGDISYGHTRNLFTANPNKFLNANVSLNWNPVSKLRTTLDFHQQNQINNFEPSSVINGVVVPYNLFGNPSFHRYWMGVSADFALASFVDVETHYRRTNITRSNSSLWPQVYSPNSIYCLPNVVSCPQDSTSNGPFIPRLIPSTSSNTAGMGLRFHWGQQWRVETGYEWIGTHAQGYLTDPGTSHGPFVNATFTPRSWLSFSNDFRVRLESNFNLIQRRNRFYANTSFLTVRPVTDWTLGLGYTYYENNMATDVTYGADYAVAFYAESLVPYKALSQSYSISSNYLIKKRLAWTLDFSHIASHSEIRPNTTLPDPCAGAGLIPSCPFSVDFARSFSNYTLPQILSSTSIDYRWGRGISSGFRFGYDSYTDRGAVFQSQGLQANRPDLSGRLRTYTVFLGKTW